MIKLIAIVPIVLSLPLSAQSHKLDFTLGYNFQNSDEGSEVRSNLNGWFSSLSFDVTHALSINVEVDNYYGSSQGGASEKQQNFVIGPEFTMGREEAKLRPLAYVEAGDQRSSVRNVEHSFDLQVGAGVQMKLNDRFTLQLVPAEYDLATPSSGATHSYTANAGISWTLWKEGNKSPVR